MALELANAGTYGALNGYWGQSTGQSLRAYCDNGVQYATLAFVNSAPEHDPSGTGYPGINFSSFCGSSSYPGKDGQATPLLDNCPTLKTDIPYCQSKGVKVLLSIGGVYDQTTSNYEVSSQANGEYFAEFLYNAFGPYKESWKGPRPFDRDSEHVAVDGFDFDIEAMFDNKPYIAMIDKFRTLDKSLIITGAPQCPTNPLYFQMKETIQKADFDALFIQFYNNPSCDAIPNNDMFPGEGFNYDNWVDIVSNSDKSQNAKLFVGLPGSESAAGSGYLQPENMKELVCQIKGKNNFGGISLWDLNRADSNISGGKAYYEHVLDALKYGCDPVPTTTSTNMSTETTSASVTNTSSTTSKVSTTTTSSTTSGGDTSLVPISTSSIVSSTGKWTNSTMTSRTSVHLTTSTVYTTSVHTVTNCPPYVTNCHKGKVTTETIPWYTTVCPVTETETETGNILQPTPSSPGGVNPPESTESTTTTEVLSTNHATITVLGGSSIPETFAKPTAVAALAESRTSTPAGSSTVPAKPVEAVASTLAIGLTGLVAMVAILGFAM